MRRIIAPVATVAALLTLGACGSSEPTEGKPAASASATQEPELTQEQKDAAREAAGMPKDPTGEARQGYLDALRAIDPWFVDDKGEQDAIDNGVNQCTQIDNDNAVWLAQQRFGKGPLREVTEAEAKALNEAVRKYICPK